MFSFSRRKPALSIQGTLLVYRHGLELQCVPLCDPAGGRSRVSVAQRAQGYALCVSRADGSQQEIGLLRNERQARELLNRISGTAPWGFAAVAASSLAGLLLMFSAWFLFVLPVEPVPGRANAALFEGRAAPARALSPATTPVPGLPVLGDDPARRRPPAGASPTAAAVAGAADPFGLHD